MVQFGIRTQDDEPDWATVKAVQESIFNSVYRRRREF